MSVGARQHTQDVRGCPPEHTGRPWLSVCVRVCLCVSVSTHKTSMAVHQYTYQHVSPWTQHADPSRGLFGMSVAVRVCSCLSVTTHMTSVAVHQYTYQHVGPWTQHAAPSRGLTHMTSVAVHQYTYQHAGPWSQHAGPSCGLFGTHRTSVAVHQYTYQHSIPWTQHAALPVDCSGDFGPRGLSVEFTQDVRGHRMSVAVRVCSCLSVTTHMTSVAVHQYTYQHVGPWTQHAAPSCGLTHITSVAVHQYTYQHAGPWSQHAGPSCGLFGTHRTSVAVHQYTYQHSIPWTQHAALPVDCSGDFGPRGLSVQYTQDVRRKHISTLVLGLSTLALPVDCSGDFGPRGLSVQYTQDVRECPSAHTKRPWVSVSTHRTSVAIHQYTYQHVSPWTQHADPSRGCPWLSVCVRVYPSPHTGRLWPSISIHISKLVLGLSTLTLLVDCSGDFGPRGLSVQYTQDVRGCPSVHISARWASVAVHQYTYQHVSPWTQHADPSRGLFGLALAKLSPGRLDWTGLDGSCLGHNLGFTMKKLKGVDRLIWTRTEPPLASGQFFDFPENMTGLDGLNWTELPRHNRKESTIGRNWPSRRHQPISFRLVAARVSLRMAPDACTATPRAPHGWLHVQDTCRTPPLLPDIRLHDWSSCKAPHILTHVDQHASVACVATSRAWPIHLVLHMAGCMSRTHEGRHHSSQMSGCMTGTHARCHSITHMAGRMLRLHARRHLVLGRSTLCFYMCSFHARRHLELL
ncbi:hypothetical protein YC2023_066211 [Brassica napus]